MALLEAVKRADSKFQLSVVNREQEDRIWDTLFGDLRRTLNSSYKDSQNLLGNKDASTEEPTEDHELELEALRELKSGTGRLGSYRPGKSYPSLAPGLLDKGGAKGPLGVAVSQAGPGKRFAPALGTISASSASSANSARTTDSGTGKRTGGEEAAALFGSVPHGERPGVDGVGEKEKKTKKATGVASFADSITGALSENVFNPLISLPAQLGQTLASTLGAALDSTGLGGAFGGGASAGVAAEGPSASAQKPVKVPKGIYGITYQKYPTMGYVTLPAVIQPILSVKGLDHVLLIGRPTADVSGGLAGYRQVVPKRTRAAAPFLIVLDVPGRDVSVDPKYYWVEVPLAEVFKLDVSEFKAVDDYVETLTKKGRWNYKDRQKKFHDPDAIVYEYKASAAANKAKALAAKGEGEPPVAEAAQAASDAAASEAAAGTGDTAAAAPASAEGSAPASGASAKRSKAERKAKALKKAGGVDDRGAGGKNKPAGGKAGVAKVAPTKQADAPPPLIGPNRTVSQSELEPFIESLWPLYAQTGEANGFTVLSKEEFEEFHRSTPGLTVFLIRDAKSGKLITFCTGVRYLDTLMPMWCGTDYANPLARGCSTYFNMLYEYIRIAIADPSVRWVDLGASRRTAKTSIGFTGHPVSAYIRCRNLIVEAIVQSIVVDFFKPDELIADP